MTLTKKVIAAATACGLSAVIATAEPAVIFDLGGKFDKSFNESAFNGAQRWADENGATFREFELQSDAQREQALRRFAESGANPIVMAGSLLLSVRLLPITLTPNSPLLIWWWTHQMYDQ